MSDDAMPEDVRRTRWFALYQRCSIVLLAALMIGSLAELLASWRPAWAVVAGLARLGLGTAAVFALPGFVGWCGVLWNFGPDADYAGRMGFAGFPGSSMIAVTAMQASRADARLGYVLFPVSFVAVAVTLWYAFQERRLRIGQAREAAR